jgi:hypothetical protein
MGVNIVVSVYGSNGERVALLYQGGISQMGAAPALLGSAVQPGFVGVSLLFNGILQSGAKQIPWLGLNDNRAPVAGGIYTFQIAATDSFGRMSSYSIPINVIQPVGDNEINIFNSAGELVYHESFHSLTSSVTDLSLTQDSFVPSFDAAGNPTGKLQGSLRSSTGASSSWSWDGRGTDGHVVAPGVYTIQLTNEGTNGSSQHVLKQVQVLAAPDSSALAPLAISSPNGLLVRFNPAAALGSIRATLYNLAGERIAHSSVNAAAGELSFDARSLSSGVFVVVLEYESAGHVPLRSILKAAIIH